MKIKEYLKDVVSNSDTSSARKFVTLVISFHFILASFVILFFAFYVVIWMPKGKVDIELLNALKEVLRYDFYIILSGFGFITSSDLVRVIINKDTSLTQKPSPELEEGNLEGDITLGRNKFYD